MHCSVSVSVIPLLKVGGTVTPPAPSTDSLPLWLHNYIEYMYYVFFKKIEDIFVCDDCMTIYQDSMIKMLTERECEMPTL